MLVLCDLENGKSLIFESDEDLMDFACNADEQAIKRRAVSRDQRSWLPLKDWLRLKTTQSDFNPQPFFLDRRTFPRFDLNLQVNLLAGCRSFACYTKDVSEGGMNLQRPLPAAVQIDRCKIQIISPRNRELVQMTGSLVVPEDPLRMRFETQTRGQLIPLLIKWTQDLALLQRKTA